jgi:hypothetical protein
MGRRLRRRPCGSSLPLGARRSTEANGPDTSRARGAIPFADTQGLGRPARHPPPVVARRRPTRLQYCWRLRPGCRVIAPVRRPALRPSRPAPPRDSSGLRARGPNRTARGRCRAFAGRPSARRLQSASHWGVCEGLRQAKTRRTDSSGGASVTAWATGAEAAHGDPIRSPTTSLSWSNLLLGWPPSKRRAD